MFDVAKMEFFLFYLNAKLLEKRLFSNYMIQSEMDDDNDYQLPPLIEQDSDSDSSGDND